MVGTSRIARIHVSGMSMTGGYVFVINTHCMCVPRFVRRLLISSRAGWSRHTNTLPNWAQHLSLTHPTSFPQTLKSRWPLSVAFYWGQETQLYAGPSWTLQNSIGWLAGRPFFPHLSRDEISKVFLQLTALG